MGRGHKLLPKAVTVACVLDQSQLDAIRQIAADRMCSISQVVREAITSYLSTVRPPVVKRP